MHGTSNIAIICPITIHIHILFLRSIGWKKVVEYTWGGCQFSISLFPSFSECHALLHAILPLPLYFVEAGKFCCVGFGSVILRHSILPLFLIARSSPTCIVLCSSYKLMERYVKRGFIHGLPIPVFLCLVTMFPILALLHAAILPEGFDVFPVTRVHGEVGEWRWESPHLSILLTKWNR